MMHGQKNIKLLNNVFGNIWKKEVNL